jgi:uncharacterized SAM-binding protein YcdF (DUF218 family)
MSWDLGEPEKAAGQDYQGPQAGPIEPGRSEGKRRGLLKWLLVASFVFYVLLQNYYPLILAHLGRYLVLSHPLQTSDIIICLSGGNVERGLAAAEAFQKGLAPRIFITREESPDGMDLLREKGVEYPETSTLLAGLLERLGVPRSAILMEDREVGSTFAEAQLVAELVKREHYRSVILITSPTHCRRAWLVFQKGVEDKDIRILMMPTPHSGFRPEDWWTKRRYVRAVILEYEKLIYYALMGLV